MERTIEAQPEQQRPGLPPVDERLLTAPKLVYDPYRQEYWLQTPYEQRHIPKDLGFSWDNKARRWHCKDIYPAFAAIEYAGDKLKEYLGNALLAHEKEIESSRSSTSELEPPCPSGLSYLPYQKAGIAYAYKRKATLIGDEMGLGKTIQAIGLVNLLVQEKINDFPMERLNFRALIVCPASLKLNWMRELSKWVNRKLTYAMAEGKVMARHADILVINYDILARHIERLTKTTYDIIILDEIHYIKNNNTIRATQVAKLIDKAKRKLGLSGTPIENRPSELFPVLHWLDPQTYNSQYAYNRRYCGGISDLGKVVTNGASNLEELNSKLRSTIMVRRLKSDVLKELPEKRRQIIEFPNPGGEFEKAIIQESKAFDSMVGYLQPIKDAANKALEVNDLPSYYQALKTYRAEQFRLLGQISAERKRTAVMQAPLVAQHLWDCIDQSFKVVVFAHHHDVMQILKEAFKEKAVLFHGKMNIAQKQESVDKFQNDKNINLFIGSIQAAGVGITLTASSHGVFAELDWVPGKVLQAEDRMHRIGQRNSVLIQHTVMQNSLGLRIAQQMIAKQEVIDKVLGVAENK